MDLDVLTGRDMPQRDLFLIESQSAVRIDDPCFFQAEHILDGPVGFWKKEWSKQSSACFPGFGKAIIGDLAGRRVNLKMIITMNLFLEDLADLLDGSEFLQCCRPDDPILKPAVGAFDLAFGLG